MYRVEPDERISHDHIDMGHIFTDIELSNPGRREITVDPASPNIPHARVKLCVGSNIDE